MDERDRPPVLYNRGLMEGYGLRGVLEKRHLPSARFWKFPVVKSGVSWETQLYGFGKGKPVEEDVDEVRVREDIDVWFFRYDGSMVSTGVEVVLVAKGSQGIGDRLDNLSSRYPGETYLFPRGGKSVGVYHTREWFRYTDVRPVLEGIFDGNSEIREEIVLKRTIIPLRGDGVTLDTFSFLFK